MLHSIYIENFILVKKIECFFSPKLNVITGESGSGKSIILDAILFCFGHKIPKNIIMKGANSCSVSLKLIPNKSTSSYLQEIGIIETTEIVIKSIKTNTGRTRFFINNKAVNQKIIKNLFSISIELHIQNTNLKLIEPSLHIEILDQFGMLSKFTNNVTKLYKKWQESSNELKIDKNNQESLKEEISYLTHICTEIENANIQPKEEEELIKEKEKIIQKNNIINIITTIIQDIESSNFNKIITQCQRNLKKIENIKKTQNINSLLDKAYDRLEDSITLLYDLLNEQNNVISDYSLDNIEERLHYIKHLARKNNCTVDNLENTVNQSKKRLSLLEKKITKTTDTQKKYIENKIKYLKAAKELSEKRHQTAIMLQERTTEELNKLKMEQTTFRIKIVTNESNITKNGIDNVQFMVSSNPGTEESLINQIFSGGELSRFIISLKSAILKNNNLIKSPTLIFDEIDSGTSGAVSDAIGNNFKKLSTHTQVISITHQAQIAGKANQHILVKKIQDKNFFYITLNVLTQKEQSKELARMISGKKITENSISAAKELITQ